MSDGRKPKPNEDFEESGPDFSDRVEGKPEDLLSPEQIFAKRKAEVLKQDNEAFAQYLSEKQARDQQQSVQLADPPQRKPLNFNRRSVLTWGAGAVVVGEAATLGYKLVTRDAVPPQGLQHGGATYTEAQRLNIDRELVNPQADVGGRKFGEWVLLMPTKLGGGTYAVDLNTGRALAWISYWNYGDYNPISHHLCAFPSADPAKGFEFVNSTQGGQNSLIYGRRIQHLSRPLRRLANGVDGKRRGNDRARSRRARHHRSRHGGTLFRHRRTERHCRVF